MSRNADKFLKTNHIAKEGVFELLRKAVKKFQGEDINVDVKKLKGKWAGFCRIRKGKLRIIAEFDFDDTSIFIEEIDWRGGAYK